MSSVIPKQISKVACLLTSCVFARLFGTVLLFFELRMSWSEKIFRDNFGFLFSFWGRACFLLL